MVCRPRRFEGMHEKRSIGKYRPYGADETRPRNRADGPQHRPLEWPELSFDLEDELGLQTLQIDSSAHGPGSQAGVSIQVRSTRCCFVGPTPTGRFSRPAKRDQWTAECG